MVSVSASFRQDGGARLGMFNATWPFATLSATPDALLLSCFGREYVFPKPAIQGLSRHRGLFSVGLRIQHTVASHPKFVVFWASVFWWTSGFRRLKNELEMLGYTVSDKAI
jgi:hypothetical protein